MFSVWIAEQNIKQIENKTGNKNKNGKQFDSMHSEQLIEN